MYSGGSSILAFFFFSSRRRHTRCGRDWSSDVCSSDLLMATASAGTTVLTEAVAIKETGPRATVAGFGEVYAFAPAFVAVHRDEPTEISFWNLQPDDDHDFMLVAPDAQVLMKVLLPALRKTTYVFTFHEEGLFRFYCTMHQPEMSGQILVLPSKSA